MKQFPLLVLPVLEGWRECWAPVAAVAGPVAGQLVPFVSPSRAIGTASALLPCMSSQVTPPPSFLLMSKDIFSLQGTDSITVWSHVALLI